MKKKKKKKTDHIIKIKIIELVRTMSTFLLDVCFCPPQRKERKKEKTEHLIFNKKASNQTILHFRLPGY